MGAPTFFIHAGLPKTGTTYIQDALWGSRDALREQDLALVPARRFGHFDLALQLRGMLRDFDSAAAHQALERFTRQALANQAGRALLSHEVLAPTPVDRMAPLFEPLERYDVHLILTVRDLGRQIPSAWQQRIQGRGTDPYDDYLDAVQHRSEGAADFWRNQDLRDVLTRWSTRVPPERIHVITSPPPGAPPALLLERFCSVVGLDATTLSTAAPGTNATLGRPQAELLRRVNEQLGDRLPHSRSGYRRVGKTYLAGKILRPQDGPRPLLPTSMRPWVDEVTQDWVELLATGGFDVVGDLEELRSRDTAFSDAEESTDDAQLLGVAVDALAEVLVRRDRELDERAADRARLAELERRLEEASDGVVGRLRRKAGAVRRRLR